MITVHISPSEQTVSIENLPGEQTLILTPEEAYSVYLRLHERRQEIYDMVEQRAHPKDRAGESYS